MAVTTNFRPTHVERTIYAGEKYFPKLYNRTPPKVGLMKRFKAARPSRVKYEESVKKYVSSNTNFASVSRLYERRTLHMKYTELRNAPQYKPFYDSFGTSFPVHPEYMHVIRIILAHFNVTFFDVIEQIGNRKRARMIANIRVSDCITFLTYILYQEYYWNTDTIRSILNDMTTAQFVYVVNRFMRDYDNSPNVRNSYADLHAKLILLEPTE